MDYYELQIAERVYKQRYIPRYIVLSSSYSVFIKWCYGNNIYPGDRHLVRAILRYQDVFKINPYKTHANWMVSIAAPTFYALEHTYSLDMLCDICYRLRSLHGDGTGTKQQLEDWVRYRIQQKWYERRFIQMLEKYLGNKYDKQ